MTTRSLFIFFSLFFPTVVCRANPQKLSDDPLFNMPTASAAAAAKAGDAAPAGPSAPPDRKNPRDALYEPDYPFFESAFQDDFCYPAPWAITSVP
jgi:hypothetical protein